MRMSMMGGKDKDAAPAAPKWDATNIPTQKGKLAIVTGANTGLGYVTALELARHGADVILACRNEEKGLDAVKKIEEDLKATPDTAGTVTFRQLDVSSLASVKAFVDEFKQTHDRLDLLVNNAGIMGVPYALSEDGNEMQFATNHLGHFALTAQLFYLLRQSGDARIVNISSLAGRRGKVEQEIMSSKAKYNAMNVYNNTKLYTLMFTIELNRRIEQQGIKGVKCVAAHPGVSSTNLFDNMKETGTWFMKKAIGVFNYLPLSQKPEMGALPQLYAATEPSVVGGMYFGPDKRNGMFGNPTVEEPVAVAKSEENGKKLWEETERLARLKFEPLA